MIIDSREREKLQRSRQKLVQQLTELNSRHIRTQGQLAGAELHLNRCRAAIESGDETEDFADEVLRHEREIGDIEVERSAIDQARIALTDQLQELDSEIQVL